MKLYCARTATLLILFASAPLAYADGPYQDLVRRLPDSTNVLITADVQGLRQALGVAPGTTLTAIDLCSLPIAAKQFVLGAHVDLSDRQHIWSIAMAQLVKRMPIQDIAKVEGEAVSQVARYKVVASRRNAYFIDLGQDLLAAGSPANRQQLKRWLSYQKNNQLAALLIHAPSGNGHDPLRGSAFGLALVQDRGLGEEGARRLTVLLLAPTGS
jgi:hypothetical protein